MIKSDGNSLDTETGSEDVPTTITGTPNAPAKRKAKANGKAKAAKAAKAAPKAKAKAAKPAPKAKAKAKKAREVNPAMVDAFGLRKGSIKSKAAALYARADGATLAEVKKVVGSVQYNVLKQLEEKGYKLKRVEETSKKSGRTTNRFFLKAK